MSPLGLLCMTPLRLAEIAADPLPPAPPRMAAAEGPVTCLDPNQIARTDELGSGFDQTFETEHFVLAWQADNAAVTEEVVATYAESLEYSWSQEIDTLGWRAPDQTDACLITVLLADFDDSWGDTGGYTDVREEGGVPYMALNTDWLAYGDDWTFTLVAHEFNHASQFAYNMFWIEEDWWYWEATAEWVPDHFYDDANTYTWSLWAYLDTPWRSLDSMAGTVQYGHFAFNTHLAETWGLDMPREVWEGATNRDNVQDAVVRATGADYDAVIAGYSSRVAALDVEERDVWLEAIGYFEMDPWTHVTELPAGATMEGRGTPQERGQNFLHFQVDAPLGITFGFNGVAEVDGTPTDWIVAVAEVDAGGGVTHEYVRADADGSTRVEFGGEGVAEVYVAVVPYGEIGESGASYTWTAAAMELPDDTGLDTDDGDTADTDDMAYPDDEEEPGACGCASTGDAALGVWGLLGGLALVRRRR